MNAEETVILVAEDDPEHVELMKRSLKRALFKSRTIS